MPAPPFTEGGGGQCSSGNQSGGFALPAILAGSYSLALPLARTIPSGRTADGWILSGTLKAQSGRPAGTLRVCASSACAKTHPSKRAPTDLIEYAIEWII